ncbi:MAG: Cu+-exporting ATPase [Vicingaceae bacterium]|jgi:Cu+-exporting ATPase
MINNSATSVQIDNCYHCGYECIEDNIISEGKNFCCHGCLTVFEILSQNEMCDYYELENMPGISMKTRKEARFDYLEQPEVIEKLIDYQDESLTKIQFYLPQIHCSACLWLLENLYKLNPNINQSRVNFLKKELYVTFQHDEFSLKQMVELLTSLGYEPKITLNQLDDQKKKPISRKLMYQIGLAGFAFGNIMLMSLPEYFGLDAESFKEFRPWFTWINLGLATPVAFYSGQDYFKSAWKSLHVKRLNIDIPIALGVLVLYLRSVYEVVTQTGAGYFDSLCGLLFFLLLGRIFQEKVYHQLSFERDYRSYFPISVTKFTEGKETDIPINDVKKGDRILIRNGELIPVDAYLIKGHARIDNSFATGESAPVSKIVGDKIYAGGRQVGEAIQLEVIQPLNQSKLTRLWNEYSEKKTSSATFSVMTDKISEWFTPIILFIAIAAGIFHFNSDGIGKSVEVVCAVLIVACPCALALAAPFTFGHATRWLGKQNCYLREAGVIEQMAKIDNIVFDKTGTLTVNNQGQVNYEGTLLTQTLKEELYSLVNQSTHPLSRLVKAHLGEQKTQAVKEFKELEGKGIEGKVGGTLYRLGSSKWILNGLNNQNQTQVLFERDGTVTGTFSFENQYRLGLKELVEKLTASYSLSLISGDNVGQRANLEKFFPFGTQMLFNQSPKDKLDVIKSLNSQNHKTMMVGDGLNDAGALREAYVGVSIAEDVNAFSPACDVIVGGDQFHKLNQFLSFAKSSKNIVIVSFIISFLYNIFGLSFAIQGQLSPVFAAILMPISSVTVVGFVSAAVWIKSKSISH